MTAQQAWEMVKYLRDPHANDVYGRNLPIHMCLTCSGVVKKVLAELFPGEIK